MPTRNKDAMNEKNPKSFMCVTLNMETLRDALGTNVLNIWCMSAIKAIIHPTYAMHI